MATDPTRMEKHLAVIKWILDLNSMSPFECCSSHSFNLVVTDAALLWRNAEFLVLCWPFVQFFPSCTHRWNILKKYNTLLTLKPLIPTTKQKISWIYKSIITWTIELLSSLMLQIRIICGLQHLLEVLIFQNNLIFV